MKKYLQFSAVLALVLVVVAVDVGVCVAVLVGDGVEEGFGVFVVV